jgi:hypothetical protein
LFLLFDWWVGKGSISFKPLSFLALDGLFDPPLFILAIFPGIELRHISFRSRFECCIGLGGVEFGFWVFYLSGGTTKYLEPVKPLPDAPPNTRLQCHPVNRVEFAVVSGLFPIDSPPHCPTIRGIEKPLKGHLLIDLFQLFQFRIKDRRIKATPAAPAEVARARLAQTARLSHLGPLGSRLQVVLRLTAHSGNTCTRWRTHRGSLGQRGIVGLAWYLCRTPISLDCPVSLVPFGLFCHSGPAFG